MDELFASEKLHIQEMISSCKKTCRELEGRIVACKFRITELEKQKTQMPGQAVALDAQIKNLIQNIKDYSISINGYTNTMSVYQDELKSMNKTTPF